MTDSFSLQIEQMVLDNQRRIEEVFRPNRSLARQSNSLEHISDGVKQLLQQKMETPSLHLELKDIQQQFEDFQKSIGFLPKPYSGEDLKTIDDALRPSQSVMRQIKPLGFVSDDMKQELQQIKPLTFLGVKSVQQQFEDLQKSIDSLSSFSPLRNFSSVEDVQRAIEQLSKPVKLSTL